MADLVPGRFSAAPDPVAHEGLVVFLIGMRVNRWRAVRAWFPVFAAMPKMLRELGTHPEMGMLHATSFWSGRTFLVVQYWRDFAALDGWARSGEEVHLPAWRAFNRAARKSDAVGIFHETYVVGADRSEAIYHHMPVVGLAAATTHVPVAQRGQAAPHRLDPTRPDAVAVDA